VEIVDLDIIFKIPQKYARVIEGRHLLKFNNGGQNMLNNLPTIGKQGPFIGQEICPLLKFPVNPE
jgi:hypothetical protein